MTLHPTIWGLDIATGAVSLAVIHERGENVRTLPLPAKDRGAKRLARTYELLAHWLPQVGWEPDCVFVEQPFGRFPKLTLEHTVGVTLAVLGGLVECPVLTLPPSQWKLLALGKGNASKTDVAEWAKDRGCSPTCQDEADALGIAAAGLEIFDREFGTRAA